MRWIPWLPRRRSRDGAPARGSVERHFRFEATLPAAPEQAFPLLCPIREREWIEGWRAEAVHTASGRAEEGAIFRTRLELGELWVTTRYEPCARVTYTIFAGRQAVVTLDARLEANEDGTSRWQLDRTYTGFGWHGRRRVRTLTDAEVRTENERLWRQLDHFLRTGRMLRAAGADSRETPAASTPSSAGRQS